MTTVRTPEQIDHLITRWRTLREEGVRTAHIADQLGVPRGTLYGWLAARSIASAPDPAPVAPEPRRVPAGFAMVPIYGEIRTEVTPDGIHITCTTCGRDRLLSPRRAHAWLTIHRRGCTPRMVKRRIRKAA